MGNYELLSADAPDSKLIKGWTKGVQVEERAKQQLHNVAQMPFIYKWLAVMPDVHWGMGATVGSVIPSLKAIIPAAVGVDLGCGMMAVKTSLTAEQLPDNLRALRSEIEAVVPHGRTNNGGAGDKGAWSDIPDDVTLMWQTLHDGFSQLCEKHPKLAKTNNVAHLGTLGTGNHFIEVCLDESDSVWAMLHSGSRGVGNAIGMYFINKAKKDMQRWFINLPDEDLAYFPEGTEQFQDYVEAVSWAQEYAKLNRQVMMNRVLEALQKETSVPFSMEEEAVNCHHNYVAREFHYGKNIWVTRKGAVSAREGQLGIIPGSMGAKSFIVRGKGNKDSFCSCSHGAGRAMSRNQARKSISMESHERALAGVECRKDQGVLDESPAAYKDIDAVIAAQQDLIEVVHTLRQVVCVKG